jgi:hypothetical protein
MPKQSRRMNDFRGSVNIPQKDTRSAVELMALVATLRQLATLAGVRWKMEFYRNTLFTNVLRNVFCDLWKIWHSRCF